MLFSIFMISLLFIIGCGDSDFVGQAIQADDEDCGSEESELKEASEKYDRCRQNRRCSNSDDLRGYEAGMKQASKALNDCEEAMAEEPTDSPPEPADEPSESPGPSEQAAPSESEEPSEQEEPEAELSDLACGTDVNVGESFNLAGHTVEYLSADPLHALNTGTFGTSVAFDGDINQIGVFYLNWTDLTTPFINTRLTADGIEYLFTNGTVTYTKNPATGEVTADPANFPIEFHCG